MKTFQLVLFFNFIILKIGVIALDINISSSHSSAIKLGDRVVITCKLSNLTKMSAVPLLFFKKEEMISEGCSSFHGKIYNLTCIDKKEYKLEILKISYEDKGPWKCMYNEQTSSIDLDVYIPNNVSISINPIPEPISSTNLGPKFFPSKHESYTILKGLGIERNPYDLRNNLTVNIICYSDCGYPASYHLYNFRNSSNFSLDLYNKSYERNMCDANNNISSARSVLNFNCLSLKLRGLINLTCVTFHTYHKGLRLNFSEGNVFILCPTDPVNWWKMTYGEMINTGIGCIIGLMLFMFLCLMICRWKSYKHKNNYDSCQEDNGDSKIGRGYKV